LREVWFTCTRLRLLLFYDGLLGVPLGLGACHGIWIIETVFRTPFRGIPFPEKNFEPITFSWLKFFVKLGTADPVIHLYVDYPFKTF